MIFLGLHLDSQILIIGDSALLLARFHHLFTLPVLLVKLLKYFELLHILALFNLGLIPSLLHLFLQLSFKHFGCLSLVHLRFNLILKVCMVFFQLCFSDTQLSQVVFLNFSEACDGLGCSRNFLFILCIINLSIEFILSSFLDLGVVNFDAHFNVFVINILLKFALRFATLLL